MDKAANLWPRRTAVVISARQNKLSIMDVYGRPSGAKPEWLEAQLGG